MAAALAPVIESRTGFDVYRGINQVAKEISRDGIAKGGRNQQQNYSFRGIDDIYNALSSVIAGAELCILPRMTSRSQEERATAKGGVLFYVTVQADFDFVSARDGSRHTVTMYGEAMDSADKATNKAMSAAYKYACLQVFCIPTEGMQDADSTTHQPIPKPPKPELVVKPQPAVAVIEALPEYQYEELAEEPSELEEQLQASIDAMARKPAMAAMREAFAKLKVRYQAINFERTYDGVLGLHSVRNASEFAESEEGLNQARACYKAMIQDLEAREKRAAK